MTPTASMAIAAASCATALLWTIDVRARPQVSRAVWLAVLWLLLIGARPLSAWLEPAGDAAAAARAYDEGNLLDRYAAVGLIALGVWILLRRQVRFGAVIRANGWLFLLAGYWLLSALWSDVPAIALRRWTRDAGHLVMALVVLSEIDAAAALRAVVVRASACMLVLSLAFIRFVPELGRTFHAASGEMMYTGVATHKNGLGLLTVVCALFLLADRAAAPAADAGRRAIGNQRMADGLLLALAGWLLLLSASATALACMVVGAGMLTAASRPRLRRHLLALAMAAGVAVLLAWASGTIDALIDWVVVDLLGRDRTLTTRTDTWPVLLAQMQDPWFGSGYASFWTGARLESLYAKLSIIQAHNGYLETYLNGGVVGLALLALLLLSTLARANRALRATVRYPGAQQRAARMSSAVPAPAVHVTADHMSSAALALAVTSVLIVYDATEAAFNQPNALWFAFLLVTLRLPAPALKRQLGTRTAPRHRQLGILPWS